MSGPDSLFSDFSVTSISFVLNNGDTPGTVYRGGSMTLNRLSLVMTVNSPLTFTPGTPCPPASVGAEGGTLLYIDFKPLGLSAAQFAALKVTAPGWQAQQVASHDDPDAQPLCLTPTATQSLTSGGSVTFAISGFATGMAATGSNPVQLDVEIYHVAGFAVGIDAQLATFQVNVSPPPSPGLKSLAKAITLTPTPGFIVTSGGGTELSNSVIFTLAGQPGIAVPKATDKTCIQVQFFYADASPGNGALTSATCASAIQLSLPPKWKFTFNPSSANPTWDLIPPSGEPIVHSGKDSAVSFTFSGIVSTLAPGATPVFFHVTGIDGYQDTVLSTVINKIPCAVIDYFMIQPGFLDATAATTPVTLSWSTRNAQSVVLQTPDGYKTVGASGALQLTANRPYDYNLTARGELDAQNEAFASAALSASPQVTAFTVTPARICQTDFPRQVSVSWSATGCSSVKIIGADGNVYLDGGEASGSTTLTLSGPQLLTLQPDTATQPWQSKKCLVAAFAPKYQRITQQFVNGFSNSYTLSITGEGDTGNPLITLTPLPFPSSTPAAAEVTRGILCSPTEPVALLYTQNRYASGTAAGSAVNFRIFDLYSGTLYAYIEVEDLSEAAFCFGNNGQDLLVYGCSSDPIILPQIVTLACTETAQGGRSYALTAPPSYSPGVSNGDIISVFYLLADRTPGVVNQHSGGVYAGSHRTQPPGYPPGVLVSHCTPSGGESVDFPLPITCTYSFSLSANGDKIYWTRYDRPQLGILQFEPIDNQDEPSWSYSLPPGTLLPLVSADDEVFIGVQTLGDGGGSNVVTLAAAALPSDQQTPVLQDDLAVASGVTIGDLAQCCLIPFNTDSRYFALLDNSSGASILTTEGHATPATASFGGEASADADWTMGNRFTNSLNGAAVSPDDSMIVQVTANADQYNLIYNDLYRIKDTPLAIGSAATDLVVAPDGTRVFCWSSAATGEGGYLLDLPTSPTASTRVTPVFAGETVSTACFSPDASALWAGGGGVARYDLTSGDSQTLPLPTLTKFPNRQAVAIATDSQGEHAFVLVHDGKGQFSLLVVMTTCTGLALQSSTVVFTDGATGEAFLCAAPNGNHLYVTDGANRQVWRFTLDQTPSYQLGATPLPLGGGGSVLSQAMSEDGGQLYLLSTATDGYQLLTVDLEAFAISATPGSSLFPAGANLCGLGAMTLSPDGAFLLCLGRTTTTGTETGAPPADGLVVFIDTATGRPTRYLDWSQAATARGDVAITPDGTTILVADGSDTLQQALLVEPPKAANAPAPA
ncbi:lactonase family protein [Endothiovibrio diazotrophicus]